VVVLQGTTLEKMASTDVAFGATTVGVRTTIKTAKAASVLNATPNHRP
jgi:hypothetical protein